MQVGECRGGEHDAGKVVVGKGDRPLVSTGRDNDLLRADAPDPLPRCARVGTRAEMVGAVLEGEHEAILVDTERGRAAEYPHARKSLELGEHGGCPLGTGCRTDRLARVEQ